MKHHQLFWSVGTLLFLVTLFSTTVESRNVVKREAYPSIDPHYADEKTDDAYRGKRKVEVITGVKNAVIGFVFDKINKFIDQKTAWIDHLDKTNIAKNKAHGIEPPKDPVLTLSGVLSGAIGQKLEAAAPLINVVVSKLGSGSGSGGSNHKGFDFGALLSGGHK